MLSFLKTFFWPSRQQNEPRPAPVVVPVEENKKRKNPSTENTQNSKRLKLFEISSPISCNLDLEQSNYTFSKETISIFKGSGDTVLVSNQAFACNSFRHRRQQQPHQQKQQHSLFSPAALVPSSSLSSHRRYQVSGDSVFPLLQHPSAAGDFAAGQQQPLRRRLESSVSDSLSRRALAVLRGVDNLPAFADHTVALTTSSPEPKAAPTLTSCQLNAPAATAATKTYVHHSTPFVAMMPSDRIKPSTNAAAAAAKVPADRSSTTGSGSISTVPKHPLAPSGSGRQQRQCDSSLASDVANDDDCVITSVEAPKSVAEIFSPCNYLSNDWLADIKTSSQSLKTYMQRVETEESLKMQYWAKRREADERDLVSRVTRNLKLAEREQPVLPYNYEEPPPTPPPPEPPAEPEFPDLSEEQLRAVDRAWSRQLPGSEVVAEGFSLRVTREEMRSLTGLNWLNDNIVNFYMQLLAAREGPGLPRVHAFSTFFYTKLSTGGYASVKRWTRKVDIFDKEVLLCPVHLHNNHWTLCIVDLRSRYIIHLDSLSHGGSGGHPTCLPLMKQYLAEEHKDKKSSELDVSQFQLVREVGAPQQENGSDCGVFVCKFADYYCKGRDFTFRQCDMPYFRKRTTLEILEKRLLW